MSTSCPLCVKVSKRAPGIARDLGASNECPFCNSSREICWSRVQSISVQMQRVADAMQAGDDDRAAAEGRLAGHLALGVLAAHAWPPAQRPGQLAGTR